eukprot:TRINITY_DN14617_c0_g1_i1.p1 TRINITY_DN14617_c0_g1~~TRINITY_DN14617_c0_g1_i1.p1  ORF type:complete len:177 (+),score=25.46 TRINITY_DN14617_c0_g1_i1:533-1063(+)
MDQNPRTIYQLVEWADGNFIRVDHFSSTPWERFVELLTHWILRNYRWCPKLVPNFEDENAFDEVEKISEAELLRMVEEWEAEGLIRWQIQPAIGGKEAGIWPAPRKAAWPSYFQLPATSPVVSRSDIMNALKTLYIDNKYEDQVMISSQMRATADATEWKHVTSRTIRVEINSLIL